MEAEEMIKALEDEFQLTKEEMKAILFDIRTYLMEATTPIPNDLERERLGSLLDETNEEKRQALRAQKDSIKSKSEKDESEKRDAADAQANLERLNVVRAHIDPERG